MSGKSKVISSSKPAFAKGGNGKMFGKQHAGPDVPGRSGSTKSGTGGKWAKGGSGKMFGRQNAGTRKPGQSGK